MVRRAGVTRLRELDLPSLARAAAAPAGTTAAPAAVERLLREAVARLDAGNLREAAQYSLGLAQGTLDWPPADRRTRAARIYGVSVERFRKCQEPMVLGQVAEQVLRIADAGTGSRADAVADLADRSGPHPLPAPGHRALLLRPGPGQARRITVHCHPVDLLRDVDVVVSPTNTFLALPEAFKSSVSASLRRAGATRNLSGGLVEDTVDDELREWTARHASPGRAVLAGTVAPTGPGALARQGIRRIYHAAVAVPLPGTNDYAVQPADVTRAVARVFALLAEESPRFDPPLRSVCLPLLGAGRGGLRHEASFTSLWEAVDAELARGGPWDVQLVVRRTDRADLVERLLRARGAVSPDAATHG